MPKVSVLMPVYNTKEEYLRESIESILNQTFNDFELIIVDDGSEYNIKEIVDSYSDIRIRFYRYEQNYGVAKTRNILLSLAEGQYAAFQDSDDISLPERLQKQVEFLDNNPDISILGTGLVRFPAKKVVQNIPYPRMLDFIGGCVFSQGTSMLRIKNLRDNNLFYDENLATSEDYDLWSRAVVKLRFANLQEVLLKYRRVNTSLCHTQGSVATEIDKQIKHRLSDLLTCDEKLKQKLIEIVINHYKKKNSFFENIFSIRNEWVGDKKIKFLTILGLKVKIGK